MIYGPIHLLLLNQSMPFYLIPCEITLLPLEAVQIVCLNQSQQVQLIFEMDGVLYLTMPSYTKAVIYFKANMFQISFSFSPLLLRSSSYCFFYKAPLSSSLCDNCTVLANGTVIETDVLVGTQYITKIKYI